VKRNEKILVYAVTGFLAVVLGIAIVFGNKELPKTERGSVDAKTLSDLFNDPQLPGETGGEGADGDGTSAEDGGEEGDPIDKVALNVRPPEPEQPAPAEQVEMLLGPSSRIRDYREVEVRRGDSLSEIVERWCGTASLVEEVRLLNEGVDVNRLRPGQKVLVPWGDDEELLAARTRRIEDDLTGGVSARPSGAAPSSAGTAPAMADRGGRYVVQGGDSAWKIALKFVPQNEAPKFIQELRRLNPQVDDIDRLRKGQELRVPAR